jgi:hypothetical protein
MKRSGLFILAVGAVLVSGACAPVISSGPTVSGLVSSASGSTVTVTFDVTWNGPTGTCSSRLDAGPSTPAGCSSLSVVVPATTSAHTLSVTAQNAAGSDTKTVDLSSALLTPGSCYRVTHNGFPGGIVNDFIYNGPVGFQNTTVYSSTNGTCTGTTVHPNGYFFTVVQASSDTGADAICTSLNAGGFGFRMDGTDPNYFEAWSTPARSYICGSFGEVGP